MCPTKGRARRSGLGCDMRWLWLSISQFGATELETSPRPVGSSAALGTAGVLALVASLGRGRQRRQGPRQTPWWEMRFCGILSSKSGTKEATALVSPPRSWSELAFTYHAQLKCYQSFLVMLFDIYTVSHMHAYSANGP